MSKTKVLFEPYQQGALAAYVEVFNFPGFQEPNFDIEGLFYSSMLQGGIEEFLFFPSLSQRIRKSDFLNNHILYIDEIKYKEVEDIVNQIFRKFMTKDALNNKKIFELKNFLTSLFFAAKENINLAYIIPIPNLDNFQTFISTELYYILRNLINSFKIENINITAVKQCVNKDEVYRLYEILTSDLFLQYSLSHKDFEKSSLSSQYISENIDVCGKSLYNANKNITALSNLSVSLFSIVPKAIDLIWGKIPSTIIDCLISIFSNMKNNDNRIVLYQFDNLFKELLTTRIKSLK